jgi:AcrR family transcriptional regulator
MDREGWEQAALDALEEAGPDAIAIVPLAKALGVTRGSFYHHFDSREELVDAAVERWYAVHVTGVLDAVGAIADPRERLRQLLGRAVDKPPTILAQLLASPEPLVRAAVRRAAAERLAFLTRTYADLGLSPAAARDQALLAYAAYLGLAQLLQDQPDALATPRRKTAFAKHLQAQLIPAE